MNTDISLDRDDVAPQIEQLGHGATCEWLFDRQMIVMTAQDSTRGSVDTWVDKCIDIANKWPANRPFCIVVDASNPSLSRTPYMRDRLKGLRTVRTDLSWYVAMVAPKSYLMQLMSYGLRVMQSNRETRIFFEREEAVQWLKSKL